MHVYAVVSDQMIGRRVRMNVPATLLSAGRGRKKGIHALLGKAPQLLHFRARGPIEHDGKHLVFLRTPSE